MAVTPDTLLHQGQAYALPILTPQRAVELAAELNTLLDRATPLIERYRYLYADPFTFLSELEALAIPGTLASSGEGAS